MMMDLGNVMEAYLVERLILEGPPSEEGRPAIYEPVAALDAGRRNRADEHGEGDDDDHCFTQAVVRQPGDISQAALTALRTDLKNKLDRVR